MNVLLKGYTGACELGFDESEQGTFASWYRCLCTSFSLSMNTNVIKSQGTNRIYNYHENETYATHKKFHRMSLNGIRDYPIYELSLSILLTKEIFNEFLKLWHNYSFRRPIGVRYLDNSNNFNASGRRTAGKGLPKQELYKFKKCYISSFAFSIQLNAVATVQLSLLYFMDIIEILWDNNVNDDCGVKSSQVSSNLAGNTLLPYYSFGIKYTGSHIHTGLNDNGVIGFSFTYAHNVTAKYGCQGLDTSKHNHAPRPLKIIFSAPTLTYEINYLITNSATIDDYDIYSDEISIAKRDLELFYKTYIFLKFNDCYEDTFTPTLCNSNGEKTINITGTIYGKCDIYESVIS